MPARHIMSEDALVRQPTLSYAPTERGAKWFRDIERSMGGGRKERFASACGAASGEVVDVVRWTEPADTFGQRISQVTYTYRGVDPLPLGPAEERAALAKPIERTVPMMLASDGWRIMPR